MDEIQGFYLDGKVSEKNIEHEKRELEDFLTKQMKDDGFIPVLDLDPRWKIDYDFDDHVYDFKLTIFGVEQEDAWLYAGQMNGKLITSSLPTPK